MGKEEFNLVGVIKSNTTDFERGLDRSKGKTKKFNKSVNKMNKATGAATSKLDSMTGGAASGFLNMVNGITKGTKAMKAFKIALAATGIGLVVTALAGLVQYLKGSAEGQKKLNKLLGGFKGVLGFLKGLLETVGKKLVDFFKNPKEYLKSFVDALKKNLINRLKGIGDYFVSLKDIATNSFKFLGAKIKQFFSTGDAKAEAKKQAEAARKGLNEGLKQGGESALMMLTGMDKEQREATKDKMKNFGKEAVNSYKEGVEQGEAENAFRELKRKELKIQAEAEKEKSKLIGKSKEYEKYTAKERLNFIKQAEKENQKVYESQKRIAEEKLRLQREEMAMSPTNQADLDKEAELENNLLNIEKARATAQREIQNRINEANNRVDKANEKRKEQLQELLELRDKLNEPKDVDVNNPKLADTSHLTDLDNPYSVDVTGDSDKWYENLSSLNSLTSSLSDGFMNLFDNTEKGFKSMGEAVKNFARTLTQQLLSKGIMMLLKTILTGGGSAAASGGGGFLSSLLGFNQGGITPKRANGGLFVGGNSTVGDRVPVLANSREMILNRNQQGNLFRMIKNPPTNPQGNVRFELEGTKLIGVINNTNRKNNKIR